MEKGNAKTTTGTYEKIDGDWCQLPPDASRLLFLCEEGVSAQATRGAQNARTSLYSPPHHALSP